MNKMSLEEYKGVFVFAQQVDNVLDGVAFELLGKGKDLKRLKYRSYSSIDRFWRQRISRPVG